MILKWLALKGLRKMKKEKILKHCPFCGGEGIIQRSPVAPFGYRVYHVCQGEWYPIVFIKTNWTIRKEEAIEAWNKRKKRV